MRKERKSKFTLEQKELLKKTYNILSKEELLRIFPGFTMKSLSLCANHMGLPERSRELDRSEKEFPFICDIDNTRHKTLYGLYTWYRKIHKIQLEEAIMLISYKGQERPRCKCGCGTFTKPRNGQPRFDDFIHGHYVRLEGNNPTRDNPETAAKVIRKKWDTTKKEFAEGKRERLGRVISEEEKIETSKRLKGKKYEERYGEEKGNRIKKQVSEAINLRLQKMKDEGTYDTEYNKHFKEYWKDEENKELQRIKRIKWLKENEHKIKTSETEDIFEELLIKEKIEYEKQYNLCNKLYDFKIKNENILIEIHGDWWHCNPKKYINGPTHEVQKHNIKNDKRKLYLAESNDYKVLYFWQSDIENNIEVIKERLLKEIR